ncbi:MAG: chemotaxis protein CheW [Gammaproteobacteria bacterium]|nr:MAG: chemotaxis protein CheW [Gammaproteobacteria bacterium]
MNGKSSEHPANDGQHRQALTFVLGGEQYGVDILRVREIRAWQAPRPLPNLPDFVSGVMDFRGGAVPVVDLRKRFRLPDATTDRETVIIVVSVQVSDTEAVMGIVVDRVADVVDIPDAAIQPPPPLGHRLDTRFMSGMIRHNDRMIVLVDLDQLLNPDGFAEVFAAAAAQGGEHEPD